MRVQIFKAVGEKEIDELEVKINLWIANTLDQKDTKVLHTNTTFGQVDDILHGRQEACVIVTVWFE